MISAGIKVSKSFEQEFEEAQKCLEAKNIKSEFDFDDIKIKKNVCYGFLHKKKDSLINQKRFLFLISSRPLADKDYNEDNDCLEASDLPSWLYFDTLYYYSFDNEKDDSKKKGEISLR
jgi:hypothetical protein